MLIDCRVAKCHGYDGYIRVKILAGWGKSLGEHTILPNEAFFGGDLHNLCEMSVLTFIICQNYQHLFSKSNPFGAKIVAIYALFFG